MGVESAYSWSSCSVSTGSEYHCMGWAVRPACVVPPTITLNVTARFQHVEGKRLTSKHSVDFTERLWPCLVCWLCAAVNLSNAVKELIYNTDFRVSTSLLGEEGKRWSPYLPCCDLETGASSLPCSVSGSLPCSGCCLPAASICQDLKAPCVWPCELFLMPTESFYLW